MKRVLIALSLVLAFAGACFAADAATPTEEPAAKASVPARKEKHKAVKKTAKPSAKAEANKAAAAKKAE